MAKPNKNAGQNTKSNLRGAQLYQKSKVAFKHRNIEGDTKYYVEVLVHGQRLVSTMAGYVTYERMRYLNARGKGEICLLSKKFALLEKRRVNAKYSVDTARFFEDKPAQRIKGSR